MAAPKSPASSEFRVALNPRNPEANSWFDPKTKVNLFLDTPESLDLSKCSFDELDAVRRGIRAGLLIVSAGKLPEGLVLEEVNQFAAPRSRYPHTEEHDAIRDRAIANWELLTSKA